MIREVEVKVEVNANVVRKWRNVLGMGLLVVNALAAAAEPTLASGDQGLSKIIFTERHYSKDPHYYANFGYSGANENRWLYGENGGRLAVLFPETGEVKTLFSDPEGAVRDPCVHYSGEKILFSYRKGGSHHFNLYEINADGSNLRQITSGDWDDVEPAYLPDGGIVFSSTRCKRFVLCWLAPVAVLFRCDADPSAEDLLRTGGRNIRQLSSSVVGENTPSVLPDGRILYTRWEYMNRDNLTFHHLWTMNPDGTGAAAFYGNMHPGGVFIDAQPVPGSEEVVFINSGGHGREEHAGNLSLLNVQKGPDDKSAVKTVGTHLFRDPYPVSKSLFLAAWKNELRLVNRDGTVKTLYQSSMMVHEPRVLAPRKRERVIPARIDVSKDTGTFFLSDVTIGRNMAGVEPGTIRKLMVMEDLPKPVSYHGGGTTPLAHGGTWSLKRILGTVPVEKDGSAFFEAPANRSLYFVALDKDDLSVKQMRSYVTLQPGENVSCIGCHEDRTMAVGSGQGIRLASRRAASIIEPIVDIPQTFDFPRDIQPILDRHCVECHDASKRKGGLELTGDHGPTYSLSYYNLMLFRQVADNAGFNWPGIKNLDGRPLGNDEPYTTYSYASPLMNRFDGSHYDVTPSEEELTRIRLWIDSAANYAGTYAAFGTGQLGGWWDGNHPVREMDDTWPTTAAARDAVTRRCATCHEDRLPKSVTAAILIDTSGDYEGWQRPVSRFSRHTIFNLSRPENSMALRVPLAQQAGGFAKGPAPEAKAVPSDLAIKPEPFVHPVIFESMEDPDCQAILSHLQAAKERLETIKRFDIPGFQPDYGYLREMKRYGVLPPEFDLENPPKVDPYELEQKYWRLFWHKAEWGSGSNLDIRHSDINCSEEKG